MRVQSPTGWWLHDLKHRGLTAWALAAVLMAFYLVLFFPGLGARVGVDLDAVARGLFSALPPPIEPSRWTLYGALYTVAVVGGGLWMLRKYRHNRYQVVRTSVVMAVQVVFAFAIPHVLEFFHQPAYYLTYFWPLKMDALDPRGFQALGPVFVGYGFVGSLVLVPAMTLAFGKRWYCSWVCGCGGLANTFGEPWRHLSSKSRRSWSVEKVSIHAVLALAVSGTALWFAAALVPDGSPLARAADGFRWFYGLFVASIFSGIVGVALYPLGGTRLWCRFGCPMAAAIGLLQKAGRFRIRVKRDMCISCGMCSTYCEMGIDVRAYAQANQSFTRASCVGCGLCAEVCPRGVLRLESPSRRG
ncbi:4Fe-4S binding protein [Myxococcota bacterium]|nr:4Fe-4S binding protein [Myxococcota bacterium]